MLELTQNKTRLIERFVRKFGGSADDVQLFYAPGRVNLIGEHTDYTGGLVFPCGIDRGSLLLIRRTYNKTYRFASTNFDLMAELPQTEINQTYGDNWIHYPLGVLDQFVKRNVELDGVDCLYSGNVPNGAGLSSSASIEVVTAFAINQLFSASFSLLDLIKMSQAAENDFVGMQCGIMDQFAVAMASENHAIKLDCATLEYRQVPLQLGDHALVLANTNQRRELLNESDYNDRVAECARALEILQSVIPINALGELKTDLLKQHEALFSNDKIAYKRALHICSENERVRQAVPLLEANDLTAFGQLMNESHDSLRDLFAVSSEPLDHLVNLARAQAGVIGSRLTGAGFGGCTINLMPHDTIADFEKTVGEAYKHLTGLTADFYTIHPGGGVCEVST